MSSLKRQFLATGFAVCSIGTLGLFLIHNVHAETAVEELQNKGQDCRSWMEAGDLNRRYASGCLTACERHGAMVAQRPETLTDEAVQRCSEAYSRAQAYLQGMQNPEVPVVDASGRAGKYESREERALRNSQVAITRASMPDVEGRYMTITKGKPRVRADSRDDWTRICSSRAFVINFPDEIRNNLIQSKTRVRLSGITYHVNAKGSGTDCKAERLVILEPSQ
jgi:hypothetical protein